MNDKTFASWRDRIRPKAAELCFETVHWLPTFWDGVLTAQKEDKPILLWESGHEGRRDRQGRPLRQCVARE